jgi:hypothetical protein
MVLEKKAFVVAHQNKPTMAQDASRKEYEGVPVHTLIYLRLLYVRVVCGVLVDSYGTVGHENKGRVGQATLQGHDKDYRCRGMSWPPETVVHD